MVVRSLPSAAADIAVADMVLTAIAAPPVLGYAATVLAAALAPVHQEYLLQARQMQALSFAVHIPLVCFGIAFPLMVLVMEWMGHRTGDPVYLAIARRWSRRKLPRVATDSSSARRTRCR